MQSWLCSQVMTTLSCVMRKPSFCIYETKGADPLSSNGIADQHLYFRYIYSTIPLLPKSEILTPSYLCDYAARFVSDLIENPEDRVPCYVSTLLTFILLFPLKALFILFFPLIEAVLTCTHHVCFEQKYEKCYVFTITKCDVFGIDLLM